MFCRNELYCSELSEICLEGIEGMHPERELEQSNRERSKSGNTDLGSLNREVYNGVLG